jgi:uncharacterized phage-associated protein
MKQFPPSPDTLQNAQINAKIEEQKILCTIEAFEREVELMLSSHDVARYFLSLIDEDSGDLISNLKLQKLVYYAQGFHLALFDTPLFPEAIEAWTHGPVVPELYYAYKEYGSNAIPCPVDMDFRIYDEQTRELLDEVYQVYGQFSAWKLRNMTHDEPPWRTVRASGEDIIPTHLMQSFFKTQLV